MNDTVPYDGKYACKVYLAVVNMFKHRGHFLDAGLTGDTKDNGGLRQAFTRLLEAVDAITEVDYAVNISQELNVGEVKN